MKDSVGMRRIDSLCGVIEARLAVLEKWNCIKGGHHAILELTPGLFYLCRSQSDVGVL